MHQFQDGVRYARIPNGEIMDDPTNMFIIGTNPVLLIDPGSLFGLEIALEALSSIGSPTVEAILLTHVHIDHAESASEIRRLTGAPVRFNELELPELAASKHDVPLDEPLNNGDIIEHAGFRLEAMLTPGHAAGHLSFIEVDRGFGIVGDLVTGWGSSAVFPPWGSLEDYLASMDAVARRGVNPLLPSHGEPVSNGPEALQRFISRRLEREREILELLEGRCLTIDSVRDMLYDNLPQDLISDVTGNVELHLDKLEREYRVVREEVDGESRFRLSDDRSSLAAAQERAPE